MHNLRGSGIFSINSIEYSTYRRERERERERERRRERERTPFLRTPPQSSLPSIASRRGG